MLQPEFETAPFLTTQDSMSPLKLTQNGMYSDKNVKERLLASAGASDAKISKT